MAIDDTAQIGDTAQRGAAATKKWGEAAAEPNEAVIICGSAAASPDRVKEFFAGTGG